MSIIYDDVTIIAIQESEEYMNMPVYSSDGYCKMINGFKFITEFK